MAMSVWHPQSIDSVLLEVELDQHDRLYADDPAVVSRFDCHNLRRLVLDDTAVVVFDVDFSADQESDVCVHAELRSHDWPHVDRPTEARWVHHALDARVSGAAHFQTHVADLAKLGAFHAGEAGADAFGRARIGLRRRLAAGADFFVVRAVFFLDTSNLTCGGEERC